MIRFRRLAARLGDLTYLPLKFGVDLLIWSLTAPLAFWMRVGGQFVAHILELLLYLLAGLFIKATLISLMKLHRQSWHKVGIRDLTRLMRASGLATLVLLLVVYLARGFVAVPRSIPFIDGVLGVFALGGMRLTVRLLHEHYSAGLTNGKTQRVLIVGAGESGTMIVREMLRHPEAALNPIAYLDDEPSKAQQTFLGVPVVGHIDSLPHVVKSLAINEVLIAMPSASGEVIRRVVELSRAASVRHRIIPGIYDILSGKASIAQLREVNVEDLLRREPVHLDIKGIADYLQDKVVLISGAAGSIGSEIVRQVARFEPACMVLVDRDENNLYMLEHQLAHQNPDINFVIQIADVQRSSKLTAVFEKYSPQVVFHAAAHKHVPLMERTPDDAILNNVCGTKHMLASAAQVGVERFVNISTDKAVRPASIMGASKRVAEMLVEAAASVATNGQAYMSVRFGNVLGSNGSVVPIFQEQIRRGGPVTITHPEMTRYFMSIPEAVQLVLQAAALGENAAIYVLDMGKPVRILDLAHDLIQLSGLQPGTDVAIELTHPRPGEKLHEELIAHDEGIVPSQHDKIFVIRKHNGPSQHLNRTVDALQQAAMTCDGTRITALLQELIPAYTPSAHSERLN